jgi:hypothetical protein
MEAFGESKLVEFRLPPLVTKINEEMFKKCNSLFTFEFSKRVTHIGMGAFSECCSLLNLAIPPNTEMSCENENIRVEYKKIFLSAYKGQTDLQKLFESEEAIINALKHRFDNLPIHKMIYYKSYDNMTVDQLNDAANIRREHRSLRSKSDPIGNQQDCLGMTPLHVLACSTVQNLELYKVLVAKYPGNLITEDRWGALPLLYAVWGEAPDEVV